MTEITLVKIRDILKEMHNMPRVQIQLSGDEKAKAVYRSFRGRHPHYPLFRKKEWGVALIEVPSDRGDFVGGRRMQAFRTNRNRAIRCGYSFDWVDPSLFLRDIMAVNQSSMVRGGRPMAQSYLDPAHVKASWDGVVDMAAVVDESGAVQAYSDVVIMGQVAILSRILGHKEHLSQGVMYLLVDGIVSYLAEKRLVEGLPKWIMYDTMLGASDSLRYFKERLGFKPYHVHWVWAENGKGGS